MELGLRKYGLHRHLFGEGVTAMTLKIKQDFAYRGNDYWDWAVWLDGTNDELSEVARVTYTLHRTFPNPVRTITDRSTGFRLETSGWGVFRVHVQVEIKDGSTRRMHHDLVLEYPDGTLCTT